MSTTGLAFLAGSAGIAALTELGRELLRAASARAPSWLRTVGLLIDAIVRAGREGRDPGALERRRLLLAGALCAFVAGAVTFGPLVGVGLAATGPYAVARLLAARRRRYRAAVDAGVAEMAIAIADAIGGGRSLRSALMDAAGGLGGPARGLGGAAGEVGGPAGGLGAPAAGLGGPAGEVGGPAGGLGGPAGGLGGAAGHELRRIAAELAAGATTGDALEAMRARVRSPRMDTLVTACLLQHRAGGDLARLLRDSARAMEDQSRLEDEVRSATAQARFTALLVVLLPMGGAMLAELASPGWFAGLWSSFLTAWLVGVALVLQLAAAVLMHRLGRVRW
jgi:tight adherence protein B